MGHKVPRFVIITKGPYKGYPGFYKGKRAGKLVIELSTGNKEALVDRDDVVAQEGHNEMIDVSPRSAQSDDIVLASPVKMMNTSKSPRSGQKLGAKDYPSMSKSRSGSIGSIVSSLEKEFNISSSKKSSKSNKMVAKAYVEGRVFEKNYVDNEYSVLFREFLEKIGKEYSTDTINTHLTALKAIELHKEGSFQKRTRKILIIAYMFVILNQEGENVPYNPVYRDIIRPNDNPEYILTIASKINYVRDVSLHVLNEMIGNVIEALQSITGNINLGIIPSKVYNRVQSPVKARTRKPIRVSLSPLRLNNYNKGLDKDSIVFALKELQAVIKREIDTGVSSAGFKAALQTMSGSITNPSYILALKDGKIEFSNELLPWFHFFKCLQKYYKDNGVVLKKTGRPFTNKVLYHKIKDREVSHLSKGISTFSQPEYKAVLSFLVNNYDQIVSLPSSKIQMAKQAINLYSNQQTKLQDEAVMTLNLKVFYMYNRNVSYKM